MSPKQPRLPLVHGAADIAETLGLPSERAAFHLLSSGLIPGARKIGGRWVLDIDIFRASFRQAKASQVTE